jgi:two-component system response regulator QseB
MKLLLAEDDPHVGAGIVQGLRMVGIVVDWVRDGQEAAHALAVGSYGLLILDLGMPKMGGMELLDSLRRKGQAIPVLVVTARDSVADRVNGLNRGADDYLVKPFSLDELTARVHALLRRGRSSGMSDLRVGGLCVIPATCAVTIDGLPIDLTAREFAMLVALMETPGNVVSLREMEERLYGWDEEVASNAVEVLLHRLRRKLGGSWIRNVRGIGYRVVAPE